MGTLACGEGDFAACVTMIRSQRSVEVEHVVILDRPEPEAHSELWQLFDSAKADFTCLVKVDADTVLATNDALSQICTLFEKIPRLTGLQLPLHDQFTGHLIAGLNAFRPGVRFRTDVDPLFCDRVDSGHDVVLKCRPAHVEAFADEVAVASGERIVVPDIPIGFHCHSANLRQAFHFGLHRALKRQHNIIETVAEAHRRAPDPLREAVIAGAAAARNFAGGASYTDVEFKHAFARFEASHAPSHS